MPTAREIAACINTSIQGPDLEIHDARSLKSAERNTIVFLKKHEPEAIDALNEIGEIACITTPDLAGLLTCTCLIHDNPRLAFCLVLARFFSPGEDPAAAAASSVSPQASIASDVTIGAESVIGPAVRIGSGTRIGSGVVIVGRTEIGGGCVVKSNTTIGESGFGFAVRDNGEPIAFPHIGGVRIGNSVEVGSNCTVARAALDDTVVADMVKMDDHVHVAHNVRIGPRTQIAAGAVISGSVSIGSDVWIGPNATIINKIDIADRAHVGIGSVVTRSVEVGVTVFGNPARKIPGST